MGIFDKIKQGLSKTKESMVSQVEGILNSFTKIDEDFFEELEETLIMSDIGVSTTSKIILQLRQQIKKTGKNDTSDLKDMLKEIICNILVPSSSVADFDSKTIILVIGVNGVGKTTTIGKLSFNFKSIGKSVILGAADTFRAAAIQQLQVWADRSDVLMIKQKEGCDPSAVIYDTIQSGKSKHADIIICDTAGRLHNKKHLMDELSKINRIIDREAGDYNKEVLLVIDATTGQNGVNQAKLFKESANITGIILTKLDGTAKGGVIIAIKDELDLPIRFIGVGEKIDDLQEFNPKVFVDALFD